MFSPHLNNVTALLAVLFALLKRTMTFNWKEKISCDTVARDILWDLNLSEQSSWVWCWERADGRETNAVGLWEERWSVNYIYNKHINEKSPQGNNRWIVPEHSVHCLLSQIFTVQADSKLLYVMTSGRSAAFSFWNRAAGDSSVLITGCRLLS